MAKKDTVSIKGIFDYNNQKVDYSSGFLVGTTPLNRVVITFYNDIPALPNHFEVEVDSEGRFISESSFEEKDYAIQRVVQNVIQLDKDTAAELAMLIQKLLEEQNDRGTK